MKNTISGNKKVTLFCYLKPILQKLIFENAYKIRLFDKIESGQMVLAELYGIMYIGDSSMIKVAQKINDIFKALYES